MYTNVYPASVKMGRWSKLSVSCTYMANLSAKDMGQSPR
jgi:hypothetical protein